MYQCHTASKNGLIRLNLWLDWSLAEGHKGKERWKFLAG